jgi:hypothetical protein
MVKKLKGYGGLRVKFYNSDQTSTIDAEKKSLAIIVTGGSASLFAKKMQTPSTM